MDRNQRRPPDVEEALSSMLWRPYERTPSESSSDEDEKLNLKLKNSKIQNSFDYTFSTYYVPSYRKIERYDNSRYSCPYYGNNHLLNNSCLQQQHHHHFNLNSNKTKTIAPYKCIAELPSYESLYHNVTPVFNDLTTGLNNRLMHSFTNFTGQSQPTTISSPLISETAVKLLHITSSISGISSNLIDHENHNAALGLAPTLVDNNSKNNSQQHRSVEPIIPQIFNSNVLQQNQHKKNEEHIPSCQQQQQQCQFLNQIHSKNYTNLSQYSDVNYFKEKETNIVHRQQLSKSHRFNSTQQEVKVNKDLVDLPECGEEKLVRVSRLSQQPQETEYTSVNSSQHDQSVLNHSYNSSFSNANATTTLKVDTNVVTASANTESSNTNPNVINENHRNELIRMTQTDVVYDYDFSLMREVEPSESLVSSVVSGVKCFVPKRTENYCDDQLFILRSRKSDNIQKLTINGQKNLSAMRLNVPNAYSASSIDTAKYQNNIINNNNYITESATNNSNCNKSMTSIFFPLNDQNNVETLITARNVITNGTHKDAILPQSQPQFLKPSLKIQVNHQRHDDSHNISSDSCTASKTTSSISKSIKENNNNIIGSDCSQNDVNQSNGEEINAMGCHSAMPQINNSVVNNHDNEVNTIPTVVQAATKTLSTLSLNNNNNNNNCKSTNVQSHESTIHYNNKNINTNCSNYANDKSLKSTQISNGEDKQLQILEKTFTSTECQTENFSLDLTYVNNLNNSLINGVNLSDSCGENGVVVTHQNEASIRRGQRRRERRERRHCRNRQTNILPPPPIIQPVLPDILHSHFPPPYTALSSTNPPQPPSSSISPVISTVPIPASAISDGRFTIPLPVIRRSPSERSGKGCCGQWFAGSPLRALIAVVAFGGVACALGGAALGATGLTGPPSSHYTAALLMIGVGVILVMISGAAWQMTAPGGPPCLNLGSSVDLGRCGRGPCSSRASVPHGLLYPEFQHRSPPPSYQASMQEYRLRLLLLDRDRQNAIRGSGSPPPTYRSHIGSLFRAPLNTARSSSAGGICGPGSEYSLPPSYRSRITNTMNNNCNNNNNENSCHSTSSTNNNSYNANTIVIRNNNLSLIQTQASSNENLESLDSRNSDNSKSSSNFNILLLRNNGKLEQNFTSELTTNTKAGILISHEQSVSTSPPLSSSQSSTFSSKDKNKLPVDYNRSFAVSSSYRSLSQPTLISTSPTLSNLATKDNHHNSITTTASLIPSSSPSTSVLKILNNKMNTNNTENTNTTTMTTTLVKNCAGDSLGADKIHSQSQIPKEKPNPKVIISSSNNNNNNPSYIISSPSSKNSLKCSSDQQYQLQKQQEQKSLLCTATNVGVTVTTTTTTTIANNNNKKIYIHNNNNNQCKELVTIVTISACQGPEESPTETEILANL